MPFIKLIVLLLLPVAGYATDGSGLTRSVGKYVTDNSIQLEQVLASRPVIQMDVGTKARSGDFSLNGTFQESSLAAHPLPAEFDIFDAWIDLSGDLDYDGYYHQIRVTFDADVNSEVETVYVKLYLSREGGDWYQYATSDLFEIYYDSVDDTYEVVSELIEGFSPGYYDVMIELHSLYHPGIVATRILDSFSSGIDIALEDLQHDEASRDVIIDDGYAHGHSGSLSLAGLIMLGLLFLIKIRYFRGRV